MTPQQPIRRGWRLVAPALACSLFLSGCGGDYEEEEVTQKTGYLGEARREPFLAMKQFLKRRDYQVEDFRGFASVDRYTALILTAEAIDTPSIARRARDWVRTGGHLIYFVGGFSRVTGAEAKDDVDPFSSGLFENERDWLLDEIGISQDRERRHELEAGDSPTVVLGGQELTLEVPRGARPFSVASPSRFSITDSDGSPCYFYSGQLGRGRVSVLAHAGILRNNQIGDADHARFLVELLDLEEAYGVSLQLSGSPHMWSFLWRHAPLFLLALAVFVVFWLWRNLPRFGPVKLTEEIGLGAIARERFSDHLHAAGRFLWRHGQQAALLEPLRRSIVQRFHQAAPGAPPEQIFPWAAERSGLPIGRVTDALRPDSPSDGAAMAAVVRDLQILEQKL